MIASVHNSALMERMLKALKEKAGADCINFILAYGEFVELWDDFIDKDKGEIDVNTIKDKQTDLYSSNYWLQNGKQLYLVEKLISLQFLDCNIWEHSEEEWKRRDAKALSHCAYNMLFAILILECGFNTARSFSDEFRTTCHLIHKDDVI